MDESKVYVGNLDYATDREALKSLFDQNGITTKDVMVITDRDTGRSKGFGFVTVDNESAIEDAVNKLNGQEFNGRKLTVSKAQPRRERSSGGGGFSSRFSRDSYSGGRY